MKTILTLVGGGERDVVVLRTALAVARPLAAHLDCLHAHVPPVLAAHHARVEFATAAAFGKVLERLETEGNVFSRLATDNVRSFCDEARIELCSAPTGTDCVSATYREEETNELERLAMHACQSDLVVMGRRAQKQGLSPYTLESLLRSCGRPILVAASTAPETLTGTIMVCWKDAASCARVLSAAAPLLATARRVVFVSVAKRDGGVTEAMQEVARQVGANDVELRVVPPAHHQIPDALAGAAEECGADLVIMGAYGRSRTREVVFGSHTDAMLERIDKPILLMH